MDISRERWEGVAPLEREGIAKRLARNLPSGFEFDSIELFGIGKRQTHVAFYRLGPERFALIPGGEVVLGFDTERPWDPEPDELASWQSTADEYGIKKTIHEYVAEVTLRQRRLPMAPFLIETKSAELGWERISLEDCEVQDALRKHGTNGEVTVCRGNVSTRIRQGDDGVLIAERSQSQTHAELAIQLKRTGFSFPTSDQWEYACGCGLPTLFRWGDHVPCDRYPTDISPNEAAWRRQWVLSGGKLEYPPEGFAPDWDHHRRPNAFGVFIASNPYKCELVAEPGTTRGGDGGCTICGGAGFFIGWLTLATAYFEEHTCKQDVAEPIMHGHTVGRRVLNLG